MATESFENKILPATKSQMEVMLKEKGMTSYSDFIAANLRLKTALNLSEDALDFNAHSFLIDTLSSSIMPYRSFIGMGMGKSFLPESLKRGVIESSFLFNAQSMDHFHCLARSLTQTNYSYLKSDMAAALSESLDSLKEKYSESNRSFLFVDQQIYPHTLDALITYCDSLGLEIIQEDYQQYEFTGQELAAIVQYPNLIGEVNNYSKFSSMAHQADCQVIALCDLLSLNLLISPSVWGADICLASAANMGLPMGFSSSSLVCMCCEQQINTPSLSYSQDAILALFYAIYHGADSLRELTKRIALQTLSLEATLKSMGADIVGENTFNTLTINIDPAVVNQEALERGLNFYYGDNARVSLSLDECTTESELELIVDIFALSLGKNKTKSIKPIKKLEHKMFNQASTLANIELFNTYHSEHSIARLIKQSQSDTLNALSTTARGVESIAALRDTHPFCAENQVQGYREALDELSSDLCAITGMDSCSLQATNFEQGIFSAMLTTRAYYQSKGQNYRNIAISTNAQITSSQSTKAGMKIVYSPNKLAEAIEQNANELALVIVEIDKEAKLRQIIELAHDAGAQIMVYTKNMDSLVGLISAGNLGCDICCFNFCASQGVVCTASQLTDYQPTHCIVRCGGDKGTTAISSSAFGTALSHLTSFSYIKLMGGKALKTMAQYQQLTQKR